MRSSGRDLLHVIEQSSDVAIRRLLDAVREASQHEALSTYLVGGCVRDAALGRSSPDLDISVEGDARDLARAVAARIPDARPTTHDAFRTATISLGDRHIDLITARREVYPQPGALPHVTPSGIEDDLARRDFTINAIAVGLTGAHAGEILDPFDGIADLGLRVIRVLHPASFRDDATRLLRAARYVARFGFTIEPDTLTMVERDRDYLATISPARVRNEILRCFAEQEPAHALRMIGRLHLPDALVSGLRFTPAAVAGWRRLNRAEWDEGVLPWLLPVLRWPEMLLNEYIERFALAAAEARVVRALPATRAALTALSRREQQPSAIVAMLDPLPDDALRAWVRVSPSSRRGVIAALYLDELRHVRPLHTSAMLKDLGVREGPEFGSILRALRAARLDNPSLTLDDERRLVQHWLQAHSGA